MFKLSQRDIKQGYAGIKYLAKRALQRGDLSQCLAYIKHCATIAQQFNWIYADEELDDILHKMGCKILSKCPSKFETDSNRVILYDDFHATFILAIQYVDALVKGGKDVLYITCALKDNTNAVDYIKKYYPMVRVCVIPKPNDIEFLKELYAEIIDFHPSKILLQLKANTPTIAVFSNLPTSIDTYIINQADQTFWLGAKYINYVMEFRPFGISVSRQRRGIRPEQQLLIPFYPIIDNNLFLGFPPECTEQGKVLVFSGGDIYKVLDDKMMYWHLVKELLNRYPEVVFLFATKGDNIGMQVISDFIRKNHFEGRFIYTKFRPDINEVFAHVDIFMGTCPVCGSLMSQLAARNGKPILQYYYPGTPDDETEQALCFNDKFQISFQDEDAFFAEADKLIKDKAYRIKQGERIRRAMITKDQFNDLVKRSLETNVSQIPLETIDVNYKVLDDRWFDLEKKGFINSMSYLYSLLGRKCCLFAFPLFVKKNLNRILNVL